MQRCISCKKYVFYKETLQPHKFVTKKRNTFHIKLHNDKSLKQKKYTYKFRTKKFEHKKILAKKTTFVTIFV